MVGEKLLLVKKAEAEAESKRLQGEGIANQRKAIVEGLRESVRSFSASVEGASDSDAVRRGGWAPANGNARVTGRP